MTDPHVESLRYRLEAGKGVTFNNPPPIDYDAKAYWLHLEDDILTIEMKDHFDTERKARESVEGFLQAWEIKAALDFGKDEIHFVFEGSRIIDRNPPPPGQPQVAEASIELSTSAAISVSGQVTRQSYPAPPSSFKVSPDVETMWSRYQAFIDNREPLTSMGYFCLTLLQQSAGGPKQAANMYNIEQVVLKKLSELTSTRGDKAEARKLGAGAKLTPLTGDERLWMMEAVKALIRQKAHYDFDSTMPLQQLKISDLPKI
jgi:hypothetical protein